MSKKQKSVIALGTFDGVHLGHQKIIQALLNEAKKIDATPIIVTFFPHPTHVLTPDRPLKMINSINERVALLKDKGIETVVVKEFTKEFSKTTALELIQKDLLIEHQMQTLLVGYDHSFGKNKEGDYETLKNYGERLHFSVKQVTAFEKDKLAISSTLIRNLLLEGNIIKANQYLNYTFCLYGKVVKGNQLGRRIGFNTANIDLDYPNKIVPKLGVYVVQSTIDAKDYFGMMNIGYRPTINGTTRTIEVHYFNFDANLYDKEICVKLLHRIRDEFKFDSIDELKKQLKKDRLYSLAYLKTL